MHLYLTRLQSIRLVLHADTVLFHNAQKAITFFFFLLRLPCIVLLAIVIHYISMLRSLQWEGLIALSFTDLLRTEFRVV